MSKLALNEIWNETAAFVKREGRLLFPIAFMLNALPMAFAAAAIPDFSQGRQFEPGWWMLLVPLAALVGLIGTVAISWLALRPGRTVGEAIGRGVARFLPLLALYLALSLALALIMVVLATIAVLLVPGLRSGGPSPGAAAVLVLVLVAVFVPAMLFIATRLMLAAPVAAAEEGGPLHIFRRTWELTRPVFWPLLGFLILSSLLAGVINWVAQAIVGIPIILVSGPPRPGSLSAVVLLLVTALVSTVVSVYITTMVARIYAALSPDAKARVFD